MGPIRVISRNYSTRKHPTGNSFPLFNVGQIVTDVIRVAFEYDFQSSVSEPVIVVAANKLRAVGSTWSEKGYVLGDSVSIYASFQSGGTTLNLTGAAYTITDISGDTITLSGTLDPTGTGIVVGQTLPLQAGSTVNSVITVFNTSRSAPEALDLLHNLTPNGSNSSASLFDGSVNAFEVTGVDAMAILDTLNIDIIGSKSGGSYISAAIKRIDDTDPLDIFPITAENKTFDITFRYANPLKFENSDFLRPDWFLNNNTVKPFYSITALSEQHNPNAALTATVSDLLGSVGWLDESYNQGVNEFTVESVSITDSSGNALSAIDFAQANIVTATISHPSLDFLEAAEVEFYLIPDVETIQGIATSHADNVQLSNFYIEAGPSITAEAFGTGGALMSSSAQTLDVATSGEITIQFTLTPNSEFTDLVDSFASLSRRYVITADVESTGGDANNNNAVTLTLSEGIMERAPVRGAPYPVRSQGFFNHKNSITGVSEPTYNGCAEDDFLYRALFDLELGADWSGMEMLVQVVRDSDGTSFDLLSRFVNFSNYVTTTAGAIQINYSETVNQYLESDDRNQVSVTLTGNNVGSNYEVQILWSLVASWRYWIAQSNALVDFFDAALPNNGLSNEWMRYLREAGYSLRVRVNLIDENNTAYYFGAGINLQDYDDTAEVTTALEYYDSSGNAQTGLIDNDIMTIKAVHTLTSGSWSTSDVWGWISLRPSESDPNKRISTVWDWTAQSYPLLPPAGETKALLEFPSAGVAEVSCRVNTSLVNTETSTVSARIESPQDPECISPIDYLFEVAAASTDTEANLPFLIDKLLQAGLEASNACCPDCAVQIGDNIGIELYAFGSKADIDALVATIDPANPICCRDEYGVTAACEGDFVSQWDSLIAAIDGDTASLTALVPSQINTYTGADLAYLSGAIQGLTSSPSIRFEILEVIMDRGFKFTCFEGVKTISQI